MIDQIEALRALRDTGTMGRAAARLRLTQSAVSKRIAALEAAVGAPLVEKDGRRVRLTAEAERLLREAEPLLVRLREVLAAHAGPETQLRIGASESLMASRLPMVLRPALDALPWLRVELHVHRGPILVERVRSGDYALGIAVTSGGEGELDVRPIAEEAMVIVPERLGALRPEGRVPVWTIETHSLTWQSIERRLGRRAEHWGFSVDVVGRLESFTALVGLARAGFGHALVPRGTADAMGVPADVLVPLPGIERPIGAIGRASILDRPAVRELLARLQSGWS
jgi:DNA-binding transcriptional LysR family regulator